MDPDGGRDEAPRFIIKSMGLDDFEFQERRVGVKNSYLSDVHVNK